MKNNFQEIKKSLKIFSESIRTNYIGQYIPLKPVTLNLLVNNVCNSKCQMCLVWKNRKSREFTPDELSRILADPLFSEIRHIGVSGGEPTLREDISEIFHVITRKRPSVKGTSIITNAIQDELVIKKVESIAAICKKADLHFQLMVSLDGIGEIHDKVRGRENSFRNSLRVIKYFADTEIPVKVGCTITSDNVWHADELLEFCINENIEYKFRVAEFIDRLDNNSQTEYIRNFTDIEKYNLGMFFDRLIKIGKTMPKRKIVYRSIRDMIALDLPRSSKCHWQAKGVTLDCEGNLYYCAPHSPVLGNTLEKSAWSIYKNNLSIRREVTRTYCPDCIHDYGGEVSFSEWQRSKSETYWRNEFSIRSQIKKIKDKKPEVLNKIKKVKKVLITGWYGSETAGDKAILASIVNRIKKEYSGCSIILASIKPFYSSRTIKELGFNEIEVISTFSDDFFKAVKRSDMLIMGGGPLMHINALGFVHAAFLEAKKQKKFIKIDSCGIGPLDAGDNFRKITKSILFLADEVTLRDSRSVDEAILMTGRNDIKRVDDPAVGFVKNWDRNKPVTKRREYLNLYLRDWSPEYRSSYTKDEFLFRKENFLEGLAKWIKDLCVRQNLKPNLLPMHHFFHGGDDREFNRNFAGKYLSDLEPVIEKRPISLDEILTSMKEASLSICMRFHSVLFANELGIPYYAVDYTSGGKIHGYLSDRGKLSNMISLEDVAAGKWESFIPDNRPE